MSNQKTKSLYHPIIGKKDFPSEQADNIMNVDEAVRGGWSDKPIEDDTTTSNSDDGAVDTSNTGDSKGKDDKSAQDSKGSKAGRQNKTSQRNKP